jgi:hypothetical protein
VMFIKAASLAFLRKNGLGSLRATRLVVYYSRLLQGDHLGR